MLLVLIHISQQWKSSDISHKQVALGSNYTEAKKNQNWNLFLSKLKIFGGTVYLKEPQRDVGQFLQLYLE